MKKRLLSMALVLLFTINVEGCASQTEEQTSPDAVWTMAPVEVRQQPAGLTFTELSQRRFEFSSGAGGWSEEFTIEKDGFFKGLFHDADMGDTGEGYKEGTYYSSSYTGHFTDLIQIDDYTYEMRLADISYAETADTIEISNNMRYIYTESYCLGGTDRFKIYLPGTPVSEISAEIYSWLAAVNESEEELTMTVIADEKNGYGIFSVERPEPLEDAQMTYHSYKESYDYYKEKLEKAETTADMVTYTEAMYETSDDCLNYIWNLIRYNTEEAQYQEILAKQREWILEKESKAKEAGAEYEGGSLSAVNYYDTLAMLTIERCEELIAYLK